MKLVYICHPYGDDPKGNQKKVLEICKSITKRDLHALPIAPQIYFPQFLNEKTQRKKAMACCLELINVCDAVWVYGSQRTKGMKEEIKHALHKNKKMYFLEK